MELTERLRREDDDSFNLSDEEEKNLYGGGESQADRFSAGKQAIMQAKIRMQIGMAFKRHTINVKADKRILREKEAIETNLISNSIEIDQAKSDLMFYECMGFADVSLASKEKINNRHSMPLPVL